MHESRRNIWIARRAVALLVAAVFLGGWPDEVAMGAQETIVAHAKAPYIRAALWASGTRDEHELRALERQFAEHAAAVAAGCRYAKADLNRAEILHRYLHAIILRRYDSAESDLASTMRGGTYNCLTATVLWIALADEIGIPAHGIELSGHVLCRVRTAGMAYDVETTQADLPAAFTAAQVAPPPHRGPASIASIRSHPRAVTPRQLLAAFYHNRATRELAQRNYPQAIAGSALALWHDGLCRPAQANLLAGVNNWALALHADGRTAAAQGVIFAGRMVWPDYRPFIANERYLGVHRPAGSTALAASCTAFAGVLTAAGL